MYVGVYATIVAASLYTGNPVVFLLGAFVVTVHHAIVLAEEKTMEKVFSRNYSEYCSRVPRYV
jgi:protein-S-isoprenylcysteine O-methyltransferase Ste14